MRNEIKFWHSDGPGVFAETLSRSLSGFALVKDWNEYVLMGIRKRVLKCTVHDKI